MVHENEAIEQLDTETPDHQPRISNDTGPPIEESLCLCGRRGLDPLTRCHVANAIHRDCAGPRTDGSIRLYPHLRFI